MLEGLEGRGWGGREGAGALDRTRGDPRGPAKSPRTGKLGKTPLGAREEEAWQGGKGRKQTGAGASWGPGRLVREIGTRPREEEQEGGRRKSGSGGEKEGGCQKEGRREAGPNFSAASWGRSPLSGLDLAVLFVIVVLSSSQGPRQRRSRVEARSGRTAWGPLAPLHFTP